MTGRCVCGSGGACEHTNQRAVGSKGHDALVGEEDFGLDAAGMYRSGELRPSREGARPRRSEHAHRTGSAIRLLGADRWRRGCVDMVDESCPRSKKGGPARENGRSGPSVT